MTARKFLVTTAAEIARRDGVKPWVALNYAADSLRACEAGTLGAAALAVFRAETERDEDYERLERAVRRVK